MNVFSVVWRFLWARPLQTVLHVLALRRLSGPSPWRLGGLLVLESLWLAPLSGLMGMALSLT